MINLLIWTFIILFITLGLLLKKGGIEPIKYKNFMLFRDPILAIFGGFVGAIFGVMAIYKMEIEIAFFLVIFYLFFVWAMIWILRLYSKEE